MRRKGLFALPLILGSLVLLLSLGGAATGAALPAAADPAATDQADWCLAGAMNGWNNASDPMFDDGTHGDLLPGDGVYSLAYSVADTGRFEWKVVECGNWDVTVPPVHNSWAYNDLAGQEIRFTLDSNDHSADAGLDWWPAQSIVNAWDDLPQSFTAVGDFQGWNNADPATAMDALGNGYYYLTYTVATPGSYQAKIVQTGSWGEQFTAQGRAVDGAPLSFTTTEANQEVAFLLNTHTGRVAISPHGSGAGNWCAAGEFNGWDNSGNPLYDDGTHGDLVGGDGIYSLDVSFSAATIPARSQWKAVECGNWDNAWPKSNNAWVRLTESPSQLVKLTFDTNNHDGDAGPLLHPAQYIPHAWDVLPDSFTAVGPFQGWDNSAAATTMVDVGLGQYLVSTPMNAGDYEAKLSATGNWDYQIGGDGRSIDGSTVPFTVYDDGDEVAFYLNGQTGRWAPLPPVPAQADHDNNIFWDDLGHDSRDALYRTPTGAVTTGVSVTVRLRAASNDLTAARVRVWDDYEDAQIFLDMERVADDGQYEWWEATIPAGDAPTIYWYRFIAVDGTAVAYYEDDASRDGGWGQTFAESPDNSWQLTVYDPAFETPDWVKNAIIYQIFTDRFRDGGWPDPPEGRFFYDELDGTIYRSNTAEWNTRICDPRDDADCPGTYSLNFYGGDLPGILEKLDYLESIGVTALYLNPIFESPSNHKYDTTDFGEISDDFGDQNSFVTLVDALHSRGMDLILDGVFNHSSSDSIYFDRYSRYDAAGNLTSPAGPGTNDGSGACESVDSPYRDWYYFTDVPAGEGECVGSDGTPNGATYEAWFGFDSLPKLDASNPEVRAYFYGDGTNAIGTYWLVLPADAGEGADGWRLDVGGDVDPGWTRDPSNNYWEEFRDAVRSVDPNAYIVIEEWGNASPWTLGPEMDATMNYQWSTAMLGFWRDTPFEDNDHNAGSSAGIIEPFSPSELNARLELGLERYPHEAAYAMMNLLGSHDTNRPLFFLDHNAAGLGEAGDELLLDPTYDWSEQMVRQKGVWLLQMTLPGAPTTYYGDEVGLVGPTFYYGGRWEDDPYNRQPYPWLDETGTPFYTHLQSEAGQAQLRDYYSQLTAVRNANPALRTGSFDPLLVDDASEVYAYGRLLEDYSNAAVVILNRQGTIASPVAQTVTVDVSGYLPVGATFAEAFSGEIHTVDANGDLVVEVPGESGVVLVSTAAMSMPPSPVTNLNATAVSGTAVDLSWTAATGADDYVVYRSLVSGGGYTEIGTTGSTSISDTGLDPATAYYYVVVSRNGATGLTSGFSNEAWAIPQYDLGAAWYNLQWPPEIFHTISAYIPTENIYGQIWVDGVTSAPGQAPGIRAQVGYGPTDLHPSDPTWRWAEMAYNVDAGNNDEYVGNLLPDMTGDFAYTTRWSGDGGRTWYYTDQVGPPYDAADAGALHVLPGEDTDAPSAPANLQLAGSTPSSIIVEWDPVAAVDLAGYEVYRSEVTASGSPDGNYQRIARLPSDALRYVDNTVESGASYSYYVVAFDGSFNRSEPSNMVVGTAELRYVEVTFRVRVPDYTPGIVYLVGDHPDLGPWNPGLVPMTEVEPNIWQYTMQILDGTNLQYKYTRGSWERVESWGSIVSINNRSVLIQYGEEGTQLVDNTATDWGVGPDSEKAVQYWRDPIVVDFAPAAEATDVFLDTTIRVTWSLTMQTGTVFQVAGPRGDFPGTFVQDTSTHTTIFRPSRPMLPWTTFTVTVDGAQSVGVPGGDTGTQQVPVVWTFTTGRSFEFHPPRIYR